MKKRLTPAKRKSWGLADFYKFAVVNIGIDPIKAYDYTPFEIELLARATANKQKESIKQLVIGSYYAEYFARSKRMPKLKKVLHDIDKPKSETTKGDIILRAMAKEKGIII